MELKVFKDSVLTAGGHWSGKLELPMEAELLIPDYQPQVFKIVKCLVRFHLLEKQVTGHQLTLSGYLHCAVFYQAEEEALLCCCEQKLPFTRSQELPDEGFDPETLSVLGEVEYLNCRASNPRRMEVRGAYALLAGLEKMLQQEIVIALADADVEQKLGTTDGLALLPCPDKTLTLEQELHFDHPPQAVLDVRCLLPAAPLQYKEGSFCAEGNLQTALLYRAEDGALYTQTVSVPFSHRWELAGGAQDSPALLQAQLIGSTVAAGSGSDATLTLTLLLHPQLYRQVEYHAVQDAFSTSQTLELTTATLLLPRLAARLQETVPVTLADDLPERPQQVLHGFAEITQPVPRQQGAAVLLRGHGTVHLLCLDSLGEINCLDKSFEYVLPGSFAGQPGDYVLHCHAQPANLQVRQDGSRVEAQLDLSVSGILLQQVPWTVVTQAACTGPLQASDGAPALRIWYAHTGDDLFAIAKHCHARPQTLLACNHLENMQLTADTQLLIPAAL